MTSKQRFLRVLDGEPVDRIPVFPLLMGFSAKQAGFDYRRFASDGKALAYAQLLTKDRFNVDVITACSDAFRISADLGGDIIFEQNSPPHLSKPLVKTWQDFNALKRPDPNDKNTRMADRALAVREMCGAAGGCAVMGWVDMPFAEACSLCGVTEFIMMMYDEPRLAHDILTFLTGIVIDFAKAQMDAGTNLIGAGDAAASLISREQYREFALPYEQMVCEAIGGLNGMVKLHICGNTTHLIDDMIDTGAVLFNVDSSVDFEYAKLKYSSAGKAFKGNLDPVSLLTITPDECRSACVDMIKNAGDCRYILSAGCEIPPGVSEEVFEAFCNSVI